MTHTKGVYKEMKIRVLALLAALLMLLSAGSLAAEEILSRQMENTYAVESDTLKISVEQWHYEFKKHDLRFYVAHVHTASPEQLRTAFAGEKFSRDNSEATSVIAARHDAVIATNGDYYNFGKNNGLVIRNGELYRDEKASRDLLLVDKDGNFSVIPRGSYEPGSGQSLLDAGIVQSFTFGPILMNDGAAVEIPEKYAISTREDQREPRTAIGQIAENHYVLIVADGRRNDWSEKGMTLYELQDLCVELGCRVAYNLDGGGSATMVLSGERINRSSGSRERDVSDIIYFVN